MNIVFWYAVINIVLVTIFMWTNMPVRPGLTILIVLLLIFLFTMKGISDGGDKNRG